MNKFKGNLTLELLDVLHLLFSFFEHFLESLGLFIPFFLGDPHCSSWSLQCLHRLLELLYDLLLALSSHNYCLSVLLVFLVILVLSSSSHNVLPFSLQNALASVEGALAQFRSKHAVAASTATLVYLCYLTCLESYHELVDALGFLALALGDALVVQVLLDSDAISTRYKERSLYLQEVWQDPRLALPLSQSPLQENVKLIGGGLLRFGLLVLVVF